MPPWLISLLNSHAIDVARAGPEVLKSLNEGWHNLVHGRAMEEWQQENDLNEAAWKARGREERIAFNDAHPYMLNTVNDEFMKGIPFAPLGAHAWREHIRSMAEAAKAGS